MAPQSDMDSTAIAGELTPLNATADGTDLEHGKEGGHAHKAGGVHVGKIGMLGSIAIAVNSLVGPGILDLPATFRRSGLIPTSLTVIFVAILSALCSMHMANTVSKVTGNSNFQKEVEFSEAFRIFMGRKGFLFTQVAFFLCATCMNLSSIVEIAQVADQVFSRCFGEGGTFAVKFHPGSPEIIRWHPSVCSDEDVHGGHCIPFNDRSNSTILLSLGYVAVAIPFIPLGLMDLQENTLWQIVSFTILLLTSSQFILTFLFKPFTFDENTLWGEEWDAMLGVILFNFAVVIAIPAWLYEKKETVSVQTVVHRSHIIATALYILMGAFGSLAIPRVPENMLESVVSGAFGLPVQIGAENFAFFIIGLDIPLFSVLARLNLTGSGLCSETTGNILAVFLPWGAAWLFYQGYALLDLLSWGGVLFTSVIAFLAPLLLALKAVQNSDDKGSLSVYGYNFVTTKQGEIRALYVLIVVTSCAVLGALLGQFYDMEHPMTRDYSS